MRLRQQGRPATTRGLGRIELGCALGAADIERDHQTGEVKAHGEIGRNVVAHQHDLQGWTAADERAERSPGGRWPSVQAARARAANSRASSQMRMPKQDGLHLQVAHCRQPHCTSGFRRGGFAAGPWSTATATRCAEQSNGLEYADGCILRSAGRMPTVPAGRYRRRAGIHPAHLGGPRLHPPGVG